jgi:hypothetical protein
MWLVTLALDMIKSSAIVHGLEFMLARIIAILSKNTFKERSCRQLC